MVDSKQVTTQQFTTVLTRKLLDNTTDGLPTRARTQWAQLDNLWKFGPMHHF
jgi:hypothetical protein